MTKITSFFKYLFLGIISFISIFPFYWMLVASTNASVDVTKGTLVPGTALLTNLTSLFAYPNFLSAIKNSFFIAIIATIVSIFFSSLAGYAFEMFRSKKLDGIFNFLLLSMMIPFAALLVPLYRMFGTFGINNTYLAVILPSVSTAFLIFFFRQNSKMFPKEINEAARIDGLSEFQIFLKIYVPIMKTTYAAAAIITFMSSWNNYMWPLVTLQSPDKATLPIAIAGMSSAYSPDYGMLMAALVITTLPTAILFIFMQKHFVAGMLGAVK